MVTQTMKLSSIAGPVLRAGRLLPAMTASPARLILTVLVLTALTHIAAKDSHKQISRAFTVFLLAGAISLEETAFSLVVTLGHT